MAVFGMVAQIIWTKPRMFENEVESGIFLKNFVARRVTNRLRFHKGINKVFLHYETVRFLQGR